MEMDLLLKPERDRIADIDSIVDFKMSTLFDLILTFMNTYLSKKDIRYKMIKMGIRRISRFTRNALLHSICASLAISCCCIFAVMSLYSVVDYWQRTVSKKAYKSKVMRASGRMCDSSSSVVEAIGHLLSIR